MDRLFGNTMCIPTVGLSREQMLLHQQARQAAPMLSTSIVHPRKKLSDELDEELLFRFGYVPFVIAEVAWDFIDTIIDLAAILRLSETRRLGRALKELRTEYLHLRREVYNGADQHEESNMILFQEELSEEFSAMYVACRDAVDRRYPGLVPDCLMMIAAVYECKIVFASLFRYVDEVSREVVRQVGHKIGEILPKEVRKMHDLIGEYAGDCPLGSEFYEIKNKYVDILVDNIHHISLNKN